MENLKEILEEVKEILMEGYSRREKYDIVKLINEVDIDIMINLIEPIIETQLEMEKMKNAQKASL